MSRQLVSSGSPLEPEIGFSRAVRVGQFIAIAGTAPIAPAGGTAAPGNVVRTRIMLTDMTRWREAARAHGEMFRDVRPACTFVQVSGFIDPA